jgi:CubicO group peptidase (beta-lactamase class C family)
LLRWPAKKVLSWDSRMSALDPAFEMWDAWVTREITIRDFYAHRSGLPDHAGDLLEDIGLSRAQILYRLRFQKPDTSFRSGYAYTNFGQVNY